MIVKQKQHLSMRHLHFLIDLRFSKNYKLWAVNRNTLLGQTDLSLAKVSGLNFLVAWPAREECVVLSAEGRGWGAVAV